MKSKFTTVILFFTMIILIAGVGIIGYAILSDLMGEDIIEKIGTYINESPSEENNDLFDYENYSISESIQGV